MTNNRDVIEKIDRVFKDIQSCKDDRRALEMQHTLLNELLVLLQNETFLLNLVKEAYEERKNLSS
jgi:hypothetical protein